ncbi:hypothetical protein AJ80_04952 [Polytolypa hystricis UAMH7299]|uniref:RING-type domain-containing protein n=1 Tax=Polytolypa hystricis (strain UAMH7299) TaxID=1447883 RepID=A0A2B7Y7K0_POLH7|nr:hypothetical protein AJ80_04952 [Polytolypa hystricis UAMH7299]
MSQMLDCYLRCNTLKCRASLTDRAVVTTCSHIFCLPCAEDLGLSRPTGAERQCPACKTSLTNPDDAVSTVLKPSEDYKTSVLSGLDPNTIMECAGRALAFWAYQTSQEIFYQEFLGKSLADKYGGLSKQMDKIIHDANAEISSLQNRISDMQSFQDQLHKKNQELVDLYREKSRKHVQITNLYNLLKSRAMRSQIQTAASDIASHTLESLGSLDTNDLPARPFTSPTNTRTGRNQFPAAENTAEQLHRHQRSGSAGNSNRSASSAMPPPNIIPSSFRTTNAPPATPQHRTRLPVPPQSAERTEYRDRFTQQGFVSSRELLQRPSLEEVSNRFSQTSPNNYGLSAGMKVGRSDASFSNQQPRSGGFSRPT